jgi:hypothetical protein
MNWPVCPRFHRPAYAGRSPRSSTRSKEITMSMRSCSHLALLTALGLTAGPLAADEKKDPPVSGLFKGNGQEAKLTCVTAHQGEPSRDKPTIVLIFTEKDHTKVAKPRVKAFFGDYGSALIITVTHDGRVVGCEVAHAAFKKGGFNDLGVMKTIDFKLEGGTVKGQLTTDGERDTFGEKWEVKLKFQVKAP